MIASLFYRSRCELGEGPLWFGNSLYWFDINACRLHCVDQQQREQHWQLNEPFSAAAKMGGNHLLLASASGLWQFSPSNGERVKLADLEQNKPETRTNDGRADRQGGFWVGTMGCQAESEAGAIYRFYKGTVTLLLDQISIPNSLCFSPDGKVAYFTDSPKKIIYRWSLDDNGWPKGQPEPFIELSLAQAVPDGAVTDSDGYIWNAQWGASRVVRYSPSGDIDQVVQVPVSQPSCPAFGGDRNKTLFVTSAREGLPVTELDTQPLAGSVFSIPLAVEGISEPVVVTS